jgi:hypothetical protein
VSLSDVLVAGVLKVHIVCEVVLNGIVIISFNTTTGLAVANLTNATAEVNQFQLFDGNHGAYTLDVLTAANTYPHAGTPKAIAFQAAIEVDVLPDSAKLRAIQSVVEIDVLPDSAKLKVYQMVIEVDVLVLTNRWYISES